MNATKRKFNALLNGIGNKSTTSLSSKEENNKHKPNSTSADALAKRRRIIPTSTVTSNSSSATTMAHQKSLSLATNVPTTPKYAPWDRTAFLTRLKSFSNLTDWTPKPVRVNEVEWAKRGWVCQTFERVRCCLCNVEILVKLNKKEVNGKEQPVYVAQNIEEALVDKYVELIITSHDEDCLWRKRGCDESIFKLPLNHALTTLQNLRQRYDELCLRKDTLPYEFDLRLPESFDLEKIKSYLPPNFFADPLSPPESTEAVNNVALTLALFGWQGHIHIRLGVQLGSISCEACFRVLGLWLFKSKAVSATGKRTEGPVVDCLNVAKEHRDYCPWSNPLSQNGSAKSSTSSLAGWEIVGRVLKNEYYLKYGGDVEKDMESRTGTAGAGRVGSFDEDAEEDEEAQRTARDAKDKERWARLRRVKSLFDVKAGKKLHRSASTKSKAA